MTGNFYGISDAFVDDFARTKDKGIDIDIDITKIMAKRRSIAQMLSVKEIIRFLSM